MSKLYIIGIGGTGARVMHSMLMLAASGINFNTNQIIPLIIDTDVQNGNLNDFRDALNRYREIHRELYSKIGDNVRKNDFFRTNISQLREIAIDGDPNISLKELLEYESLNGMGLASTRKVLDLLFGTKNLGMKLSKGFLGNPNVGSIVLNKIIKNPEFRKFTTEFTAGDRIFIIGSIFGGTGAAGFPLLLKNFRDPYTEMDNGNHLNNAIIGGLSVLPYFSVEKDNNSAIASNTFTVKTKAALSYYNSFALSQINALYYIGDKRRSMYSNNDGGSNQRNRSAFIELASALSIVEFLNFSPSIIDQKELTQKTSFFEFGIADDKEKINLTDLTGKIDYFNKPFIKFFYSSIYFSQFINNCFNNSKSAWRNFIGVSDGFLKSEFFVNNVQVFYQKYFFNYLLDLNFEQHGRKFIPFFLDLKNIDNNLTEELKIKNPNFIESEVLKKNKWNFAKAKKGFWGKSNPEIRFEAYLNEIVDKIDKTGLDTEPKKVFASVHDMSEAIYNHWFQF